VVVHRKMSSDRKLRKLWMSGSGVKLAAFFDKFEKSFNAFRSFDIDCLTEIMFNDLGSSMMGEGW